MSDGFKRITSAYRRYLQLSDELVRKLMNYIDWEIGMSSETEAQKELGLTNEEIDELVERAFKDEKN